MIARVEALEAENAAQKETIEQLQGENTTLQADIAALETGVVTPDDLADYALSADVDALAADVAGHETRIAAIEGSYATQSWVQAQGYATETWVDAQSYLTLSDYDALKGAINANAAYVSDLEALLDGRLDTIEGGYLVAADLAGYATEDWVSEQGYATAEWVEDQGYLTDLLAWQIDSDLDLAVPEDYATLEQALASLDHVSIASDAIVRIVLDSGTYVHAAPITVRHPDGDRIHIVGDGLGAELSFAGTHGFVIEEGGRLGLLDNVVLTGDGTNSTAGIFASSNATIELGEDVTVSGFYHGIIAQLGAAVIADGVASDDNGYLGFYARYGGLIFAPEASATDNVYYGFAAGGGGRIYAQSSAVTGDGSVGYFVFGGSWIDAESSDVAGQNSGAGYYAADNSTIMADGSGVSGTGGVGYSFVAVDGSYLSIQAAKGSTGSGCYAHTKSLLHINGATSCASYSPSTVTELFGSGSPSGSIVSW